MKLNSNSSKDFILCEKTTAVEYLNKYWTRALYVIGRIEKQWEFNFKKEQLGKDDQTITKIKNVLNCYQLLIVQFNQYCQVLELSGLGKCMLKIFIQIISIVETILKSQFFNPLQSSTKSSKFLNAKQKHIKRTFSLNNNQYFARKEKTNYQVRCYEEEINKIQNIYKESTLEYDDVAVRKAKEKVFNIQPSNAESMIRQAYLLFEGKYNSFIDMIEFRINKIKVDDPKDCKKSTQVILESLQYDNEINKNQAVDKLMKAVQKFCKVRQLQRKEKMVNAQTQINMRELIHQQQRQKQNDKWKQKQVLKQEQIKQLKAQLKQQRVKISTLEKLLKEKTEKFQKQFTKHKAAMIKLEQRVSINSKISRPSELIVDLASSEYSMGKDNENSDKQTGIIEKKLSKLKKKGSSTFINRLRPRQEMQENQMSKKQLEKVQRKLTVNVRAFSLFLKPLNLLQEKKPQEQIQIRLKQPITYSNKINLQNQTNAMIQTDSFIQKSQIKKEEKGSSQLMVQTGAQTQKQKVRVVKFKNLFNFQEQFSISVGFDDQINDTIVNVRQKQINLNCEMENKNFNFNLLRKKKGSVVWPLNKNLRGISNLISDNNLKNNLVQQKRSYSGSENAKNIQSLYVGVQKSSAEKSQLMKSKSYSIKNKVPEELAFLESDINNLFLKTQKALNYEFLNYNMGSFHNTYQPLVFLKSQRSFNSIPRRQSAIGKSVYESSSLYHRPYSSNYFNRQSSTETTQYFIETFYRHLKKIKNSNKIKYEKVRNFLRYPHSAIYRSEDEKWKRFSKKQEDLEIQQVRKIMTRLHKIHMGCERKAQSMICKHLQEFFNKIGLTFVFSSKR